MAGGKQSGFIYGPDQKQKRKHHGSNPFAEIVLQDEVPVGKCPGNMTLEQAQALLDEGFPFSQKGRGMQGVYAVASDGVLYRAIWTTRGRSLHGFPEQPEKFPRDLAGKDLKDRLLARAKVLGCETELRVWMRW